MAELQFTLLDGFRVNHRGNIISSFATRKVQALLAYLVVEAGRAQRREFLAHLLWGEQPQEKALHSLRQAVSVLRQTVPDTSPDNPFLLVTPDDIRFNPESDYELDVDVFCRLTQQGMPSQSQRLNVGRLHEAARLYQSPFLDQFFLKDAHPFEEWAVLKREILSQQMNDVLLQICLYHERRQEYSMARRFASRLMQLMPWNESAHTALMRLYALEGEYAAAENQFYICQKMCRQQLGIEPSMETQRLFESIHKRQKFGVSSTRSENVIEYHQMYAVPLVGREKEMSELTDLLADPRNQLVTLHGIGGVGKTRLALELARTQVGVFSDGVFFVGMAGLTNPNQMPAHVGSTLGLDLLENQEASQRVLQYLRKKQLLMVLDNFDSLMPVKEVIIEWIKNAPDVVLLITSRERLNLSFELVYPLSGLQYPPEQYAEKCEEYAAVRLFREHTRRLGLQDGLSQQDINALFDICQQVEGLPLALELAAASVWNQSLPEIARAIRKNLAGLEVSYQDVPHRHRSLWATYEYSTKMLSVDQLYLFYRLAVFPADFSHEAAMEICGFSQNDIISLIDKSILRRNAKGRFEMHTLTRQYASQGLESDLQLDSQTRQAFICYFHRFIKSLNIDALSSSLPQAVRTLEYEMPAVLRAFDWMVELAYFDQMYELLPSMYLLFHTQSRFTEAISLINQLLLLIPVIEQTRALQARLRTYTGAFYQLLNNVTEAELILKDILVEVQALAMTGEHIMCLNRLACCAQQRGESDQADKLAEEAVEMARLSCLKWEEADGLYIRGLLAYRSGNILKATQFLEESLAIGRSHEAPLIIMPALNLLADIACHIGDYTQGKYMLEECLALSRELGSHYHHAVHLNNLGTILQLQGDYASANILYEQSLEECIAIGASTREGIVRNNMGEIAMLCGNLIQAEENYNRSYEIGCEIEDLYLKTVSLNNLAEIARLKKCFDKAMDFLVQSILCCSQAQMLPKMMIALYEAACVMLDQGKTGNGCALLNLVIQHQSSEEDTRVLALKRLEKCGESCCPENIVTLEEAVAQLTQEVTA